jgi:ribose transport system ATP-binding protein
MAAEGAATTIDRNDRVLDLLGVRKRFGGVVALDGVDFDLRRGEVHGLVGENGAGKSTLVKIIAGVHHDYEGEMLMNGQPVRFRSPAEARAGGIGMVHQELSIIRPLSVAENVFLGTRLITNAGVVRWSAMCEQASVQLAELGIHVDVKEPAGLLNVGVQQLIEIARTIFSGAEIIILDEPTSALSPPEAERLFEFIALLKRQGNTIVYISHFLEDVLRVSDRITVLKNGRLVCTVNSAEASKNLLIEAMLDADARLLKSAYSEEASHASLRQGRTVLKVEGLGKTRRFSDISFELHEGEILGLYGFMGAGMTEVATCLFGYKQADQGTIYLEGKPVQIRSTTQAKRLGIAYVADNRKMSIFPGKEVFKNVSIAYLERMMSWVIHYPLEVELTRKQIERVGVIPPNPFLNITSLSGGLPAQSAHPERADAGDRCGRQGRSPAPDPQPARGRRVHHPHLFRAGDHFGQQRPHRGHVQGTDHATGCQRGADQGNLDEIRRIGPVIWRRACRQKQPRLRPVRAVRLSAGLSGRTDVSSPPS